MRAFQSLLAQSTQRKNRLRHFVYDGVWSTACEAFADSNFSAFATFLTASAGQLGVLTSLQNLISCSLQLWSEKLVQTLGSRKKLVLICVSFQIAILSIILLSIPFGWNVLPFLAFALVFTAFGGLSGPVWSSWVSELLPKKRRGLYFGIRNQRTYPTNFISLLLGGFIFQAIEDRIAGIRGIKIAFFSIFSLGIISKIFSLRHLTMQPEKPFEIEPSQTGPFDLISEGFQNRAFRRMIYFFFAIGFAINLSSPFTTTYLLQTLKLTHLQFSLVTAAYVGARFLAAPTIGRLIDTSGSKTLLLVSTLLLPLNPLGWRLSSNYYELMGVQLFGGLNWAVFELSTFIFLTETSSSHDRQKTFTLKHIAYGLGLSGGAILGGVITHYLHHLSKIFIYSFLMRIAASVLVFRMIGIRLHAKDILNPSEDDMTERWT